MQAFWEEMKKNEKTHWVQVVVLITTFILIFTGTTVTNAQLFPKEYQSSDVVAYVPVTLTNYQSIPILNGTQVLLNINWSNYRSYLSSNLSNVEFFNYNFSPLYAWIETNASSTAQKSLVWIKLNRGGINANSQVTIYLGFLNLSTNNFSPEGYLGEAPRLSSSYGVYDNGPLVFNYYTNFYGNVLPNDWLSSNMDFTVSNGITAKAMISGSVGSIGLPTSYDPEDRVLDVSSYFSGLSGSTVSEFIGWETGSHYNRLLGLSDFGNGSQYSLVSFLASSVPTAGESKGIPGGSLLAYQTWSIGSSASGYDYIELNYSKETTLSTSTLSTNSYPEIFSTTTSYFVHIQWIRVRTDPPNNVMPSIVFGRVARPYSIVFEEYGLPDGTQWSVSLGGNSQSSTSSSMRFPVSNGTYSYLVQNVDGFLISPSNSSVSVNGTNVTIALYFLKLFQITLTESGLPSTAGWNVTVLNETYSSKNSTIYLELPNGTYSYSVQNQYYFNCTAPNGTFKVNGNSLTVNFQFVQIIQFAFIELGLPTGSQWSVYIDGKFFNSSNSFIEAYLPNGSYKYVIILPSGYESNSIRGNVNWNNTVVLINSFSPIRNDIEILVMVVLVALATVYFVRKSSKVKRM
jgi:hypothetical protein